MSIVETLKQSTPKYKLKMPSTGETKTFRPFLVKEEKILLIAKESEDNSAIVTAIKDLVLACVEGIDDIDDMPMFDIEYMYLQLRAKSIGEILNPQIICPHTKEIIRLEIDIDDIKVEHQKKHTNEIKITDDIIMTMKFPSIGMMEKVYESTPDDTPSIPLFYIITNTIEKIETKEETVTSDLISKEEAEEFINNLTKEQYEKVVEFYTTSPKLEYTARYETSDGEMREIVLRGLFDFFK